MTENTSEERTPGYDKADRASILGHAAKLTGHMLSDFSELNMDAAPAHVKGYFGQALETFYFEIENNSSPLPDFPEAGIELKSTPLKNTRKGLVSKERLVLGIIDYMKVTHEGSWHDVFERKNGDLLIVFYRYEPDVPFYHFEIVKVVEWTFPEEDLRIMKEDWSKIEEYIL